MCDYIQKLREEGNNEYADLLTGQMTRKEYAAHIRRQFWAKIKARVIRSIHGLS